mmetsp:Transcript_6801/g.19218  ORF Transcript_6801/g.19218 Transcript_6801/m.19218 type:complete len:216 (-) Transcript_6801:879-1526(-)
MRQPLLRVLPDVCQHVGLVVWDAVDRRVEVAPLLALAVRPVVAPGLPGQAPDRREVLGEARDHEQARDGGDAPGVLVPGEDGEGPLLPVLHVRDVLEHALELLDPAALDPGRLEVDLRCELILVWGVGAIRDVVQHIGGRLLILVHVAGGRLEGVPLACLEVNALTLAVRVGQPTDGAEVFVQAGHEEEVKHRHRASLVAREHGERPPLAILVRS